MLLELAGMVVLSMERRSITGLEAMKPDGPALIPMTRPSEMPHGKIGRDGT